MSIFWEKDKKKYTLRRKNLALPYSVFFGFFDDEKEFNTSITLRFAAKLSIAAKVRL